MPDQKDRAPDADLRLPDGTHLMLYRNEGWTDHETQVRVMGDRMVALEQGHRIVVFVYKENSEQVIRMIYDSHTMQHGEDTTITMPPDVKYWSTGIDGEQARNRYLDWYGMFKPLL